MAIQADEFLPDSKFGLKMDHSLKKAQRTIDLLPLGHEVLKAAFIRAEQRVKLTPADSPYARNGLITFSE